MAGVAQVWLSEDELDVAVKAIVRYLPVGEDARETRGALLDKLRPLAYGTSCDVSADGGISCRRAEGPVPNSPMYQHGYDEGFEDGYDTGWAAAGGASRA